MGMNLINHVQSEMTDDIVGKLASSLGDAPAKTQSALGYAVPTVLGGMFQKAQTPQGATELLGALQQNGVDGSSSGNFASVLRSSNGATDLIKMGGPLLTSLFGVRQNGVIDAIAGSSGLGKTATGSLLALMASYIARIVGSEAKASGGFNAASLASLLGGQGRYLATAMPSGLAQMLGISSWDRPSAPAIAGERSATTPLPPHVVAQRGGGMGWLKWAIPVLAVGLLLFWRGGGPSEPFREDAPSGVVGTTGSLSVPALVPRRLSCGQNIDVAPNGVEANMLAFIDGRQTGDSAWYTFDRLEFETASARLSARSEPQVRNIAFIMNCYPNVHLEVAGFSDNVGDAQTNMKLSQERAENTVAAIIAQGIPASRLEAVGFGDQRPAASNETAEGRQRNRRIDVRVTQK